MSTILEDLALLLARVEAQKQLEPRGWWPSDESQSVVFAGKELGQDDLASVVFKKYESHFLTEAGQILAARSGSKLTPTAFLKKEEEKE